MNFIIIIIHYYKKIVNFYQIIKQIEKNKLIIIINLFSTNYLKILINFWQHYKAIWWLIHLYLLLSFSLNYDTF